MRLFSYTVYEFIWLKKQLQCCFLATCPPLVLDFNTGSYHVDLDTFIFIIIMRYQKLNCCSVSHEFSIPHTLHSVLILDSLHHYLAGLRLTTKFDTLSSKATQMGSFPVKADTGKDSSHLTQIASLDHCEFTVTKYHNGWKHSKDDLDKSDSSHTQRVPCLKKSPLY